MEKFVPFLLTCHMCVHYHTNTVWAAVTRSLLSSLAPIGCQTIPSQPPPLTICFTACQSPVVSLPSYSTKVGYCEVITYPTTLREPNTYITTHACQYPREGVNLLAPSTVGLNPYQMKATNAAYYSCTGKAWRCNTCVITYIQIVFVHGHGIGPPIHEDGSDDVGRSHICVTGR